MLLEPHLLVQFPVLLTYQSACDLRVAKLMRLRGLGNSASQLRHKLMEQHSELWSQRMVHYHTDCQSFVDVTSRHLLVKPDVRDPPPMAKVPGYKWLQTVYCNDVIQRLDEVKAAITSVFGKVLKLDSTKKVVKKLAGHSAGTASWATNSRQLLVKPDIRDRHTMAEVLGYKWLQTWPPSTLSEPSARRS